MTHVPEQVRLIREAEPFNERRRRRPANQSPIEMIAELPALMILERIPVAVIAVDDEGNILFANEALGAMLGHSAHEVMSLKFRDIFHTFPADESAATTIRSHAGLVVELRHADGSIVQARMSKSALLRGDDRVALAAFQDLTEQLWRDGH